MVRDTTGVNSTATTVMTTTRESAERGEGQQRDERDRQGQERLDDATDTGVDPPAEESGDQTEDGAEEHADQRRRRRDDQDVAGAGHDTGQHVTGRLVRTEPVVGARTEVLDGAVVERIVRGDPVADRWHTRSRTR